MSSFRSRLTSLSVNHFKGFEAARAPLGGFTVIVGTNASGKSNLRDAFRFLHGIARRYTLPEIIGEKWIEGGVLQWRGLRGGVREVAYAGSDGFAIEVGLQLDDDGTRREASYRIQAGFDPGTGRVVVVAERLVVTGRGEYIFDTHPTNNAPEQPADPHHFAVRVKKQRRGFVGRGIDRLLSDRPALAQLAELDDAPKDVRTFARETLDALASMRFLDLSPDAMRLPSLPGQLVLGDRGENLSSVLQDICSDQDRKAALVKWVRELTPLDVTDFRFVPDQAGRLLVALVEANGRETSAYSASDGTLRFLAMVAAFLGEEPARLYFFEELETGLHPTRLHLLLQLIESQVRAGSSQVIATTHSPQLLAFLTAATIEDALVTFRKEGEPSQHLRRLTELPDAKRLFSEKNLSRLYAAGWIEDAIAFSNEGTDA